MSIQEELRHKDEGSSQIVMVAVAGAIFDLISIFGDVSHSS